MRPGLTILLPTRDRPQQFLKAVTTAFELSSLAEKGLLEVFAYVDEDDPQLKTYQSLASDKIHIRVGKRLGATTAVKVLARESDTEWMMFGADDTKFKTYAWDERLIVEIPPDKVGVSFPEDGRGSALNHFVCHRKMMELTGLWPDIFWHFGADTYLSNVMKEVGRLIFVKKVVVLHLKAKLGYAPLDDTYYGARKFTGRDADAFKTAMEDFYDRDVKILKEEINRCAGL